MCNFIYMYCTGTHASVTFANFHATGIRLLTDIALPPRKKNLLYILNPLFLEDVELRKAPKVQHHPNDVTYQQRHPDTANLCDAALEHNEGRNSYCECCCGKIGSAIVARDERRVAYVHHRGDCKERGHDAQRGCCWCEKDWV